MKYLLSLVLGLVAVVVIAGIVSEGVVPDGAAVASQVQGTVRIVSADVPAGRPLKNNDTIAKNDRVEVQANSRLELRLPDGSFMRLSENSDLTMRLLHFEKKTRTMNLQARLDKGRLWAKMKKRTTPGSVEVVTKSCCVAGREGIYAVDGAENASATINVYEGAILVMSSPSQTAGARAEAQAVSVPALQQIVVTTPEGVLQSRDRDPKTAIDDWTRWNLQRDAREDLASITIAPPTPTVTRGRSLQFAAVAHYPDKSEKDVTSFATWSSSAVKIAKIDQSGNAAGTELGTSIIAAGIDDMSGSTLLTVSREVVSIKVTPVTKAIVNGASQQFTAIGTFSDRTVKDITSSAVWHSSNTNVAVVDATGRAVGGNQAGTAVITASMGTKRASSRLTVRRELVSIAIMPATATVMLNEIQRFGAIGSYSDKTTEDLTEQVLWESSDSRIAEVDEAQAGRVVGKQIPGSATIRASLKGKAGTGTITIYTLGTQ